MNNNTDSPMEDELEKCKDPVYFYENYFLVDGKKPTPLTESQKELLRTAPQHFEFIIKGIRSSAKFAIKEGHENPPA